MNNIKDINNIIGELLRDLRKRKGITEKELGKLFGVSQQQISRYENGVTNITVVTLAKLLCIFEYPLLDFIEKIDFIQSEMLMKK